VPGPSAPIAALAGSGLPTDRFVFDGFLPARRAARRKRLQVLAGEGRTLVLLESAHRLAESLEDLAAVFGEQREVCLAREISKLHETFLLATAGELARRVRREPEQQRGEVVLVVAGCSEAAANENRARAVLEQLLAELPASRAAALASRLTGVPRARLYQWTRKP